MITKFKIIFAGFCSILMLLLGIGGPFLLDSIIHSQIIDQVVMTSDNQGLWAQIPGEAGVDIIRNITFYNFTNSRDVIFKNSQPELEEIGPYSFWELHNFTDPVFNTDDNTIDYNFWQFFKPAYNTTGKEKVQAINVGPMGAWMQMKAADMPQIALTALSQLILSLKEQMAGSVVAMGISSTLFPSREDTQNLIKKTLKKIPLSTEQLNSLTDDPNYGLNEDTLYTWAIMTFKLDADSNIQPRADGEGTFTMLQNYFGFTFEQIKAIKNLIYNGTTLKQGAQQIYQLVVQGKGTLAKAIKTPYCKRYKDLKCDPNLLAAMQWTYQGITNDQPVIPLQDTENIPSIAMVNSTLIGYPEIKYYFTEAFSNKNSDFFVKDGENPVFAKQFDDQTYWVEWGLESMKSLPGDKFVTTPHALLNIGNLRTICSLGQKFDEEKVTYSDSKNIEELQKKLNFDNKEKTYIFWEYLKYIVYQFAEFQYLGGDSSNAALGQVVGSGFANIVESTSNILLPRILAETLSYHLKEKTCVEVFTTDVFSQEISQNICNNVFDKNEKNVTPDQFLVILEVCSTQNPIQVDEFLKKAGIEQKNLNEFCTDYSKQPDGEETTGSLYEEIMTQLATIHNCQYKTYCTSYELTVIQWVDSSVTYNLPQILDGVFKPSKSIHDWFPKQVPVEYELGWFNEEFKDLLTQDEDQLFVPASTQDATAMLSYDKLFAGPLLSAGLLYAQNPDYYDQIEAKFGWTTNPFQFLTYLRYLGLYTGFGGFIQTRTVTELLMGYTDPFVNNMKTMNPQEGGDPSIDSTILLMDPNVTSPDAANTLLWKQSMYSGGGDIDQLRLYSEISGNSNIVVVKDMFDGENVYEGTFNPFAELVPIYGTDGSMSKPFQQEGDDYPVYIYNLYNGKNLTQNGTVEHSGLETFRYQPTAYDFANGTTNPDNAKFYCDGPNGVFNMELIQGAPIWNSQTHFYEGDEDLQKNLTITRFGKKVEASQADETFIDADKYTGTTISVVLNLQINYKMSSDLLFPIEFPRYIPIYYMYRASTWTDEQVSEQFGALKIGLGLQIGLLIGGCALGGILLILTGFLFFRFRKQQTQEQLKAKEIIDLEGDGKEKLLAKGSEFDSSKGNLNYNYSTKISDNNN